MKRFLFASALALTVLGLSQGRASAICFEIHKPCIEIPLPSFPLVIPNIKITCYKCGCAANRPAAPNPWYMYYPPTAYGAPPVTAFPGYGQAPVPGAPVPLTPLPAPAPAEAPKAEVKPVAQTQEKAAAPAKRRLLDRLFYAPAKKAEAPAAAPIKPVAAEQPMPVAPTAAPVQMVPQAPVYNAAPPAYWYSR
jgi:hypothetical protein